MANDLFEYDSEANVLRFLTPNAAPLLFHWLTRGKHGDHLDPLLTLNGELAHLLQQLPTGLAARVPRVADGIEFGRDYLTALANSIAAYGGELGWWSKDRDARAAFIRDVVAAPHTFSRAEVEFILDAVDSEVFRARKMARDAGAD